MVGVDVFAVAYISGSEVNKDPGPVTGLSGVHSLSGQVGPQAGFAHGC